MAKAKQLKSSSPINKKAALVFVALFALVGGVSLYVSHAAPHKVAPSNNIYSYVDVNSFYINGVQAAPIGDTLAFSAEVQVAAMNTGDSLTWGGKGAAVPGYPTVNSTSFCFTLRSATSSTASIQFGNTPYTVKASPLADYGSLFWTYVCNASPALKVVDGSIRVYRVDFIQNLAY